MSDYSMAERRHLLLLLFIIVIINFHRHLHQQTVLLSLDVHIDLFKRTYGCVCMFGCLFEACGCCGRSCVDD